MLAALLALLLLLLLSASPHDAMAYGAAVQGVRAGVYWRPLSLCCWWQARRGLACSLPCYPPPHTCLPACSSTPHPPHRPQAAILNGETHEKVQDLLLLDVIPLSLVSASSTSARCSTTPPAAQG